MATLSPEAPPLSRAASRFLSTALIAGIWTAASLCAAPVVLFVSPRGNDAWSGRRPTPTPENADGPLATLQRARDVLRRIRREHGLPEGATVFVRGGTYFLSQPFVLGPQDSGTARGPVVYRAYKQENPILTGGRPIHGFRPYKRKIWKTDVAAQGFRGFYFRQLFYNGKRQHLARYPNFDPSAPICGGWAFIPGTPRPMYGPKTRETLAQRNTLHVRPADIHPWAHPEDGEVFLFPRHNWWNHIVHIAAVDPAKGIIRLQPDRGFDARLGDPRFGMKPGCRYYVRNLFEELDAPGEWFLDRRTWTLYFRPPGPLAGAVITAPRTNEVVRLENGTAYVTLRGFTITCSEHFGVFLDHARHCLIAQCTIHDVGGYCRWGDAAIAVRGGHDNQVIGNDIYNVGAIGIDLRGGNRETLAPGNNLADDNYIHHTGIYWKAGSGISCSGVGNRVSHNLIHDTPRQGIRWNGNDHVIEFNHLRETNTEISDTAAINACNADWTKRGTVIRFNSIHDTLGFGMDRTYHWVSPYYCWGIYLDNFTSGTRVYGNLCVRIARGGVYIHGGRDNVVENNFIIDCAEAQMQYSPWKPGSPGQARAIVENLRKYAQLPAYRKYPGLVQMLKSSYPDWVRMAGNRFVHNICSFRGRGAALYKQRGLSHSDTVSDYNLVWHHGLPLAVGLAGIPLAKQWQAWKHLGFEQHSRVQAPQFTAPNRGDYHLKPDSPAFPLGIQPLPLDKIGPYPSPLRASWPIVEAPGVREHPLHLERMPAPPARTPAKSGASRPIFRVPRRTKPIRIDGRVTPAEWGRLDARHGIALHRNVRNQLAAPASFVYLAYDAEALYIAFVNPLAAPPKPGATWGRDTDAVEIALRTPSGPVVVLRGFLDGTCQSSGEAGAPPETAKRAAESVQYAARRVGPRLWTAEWKIPFAAIGANPARNKRFACNLTVRKTTPGLWLMWRGTHGSSWQVARAGTLLLAPQ